ncbi:hypothetical protein [Pseudomonas entomophila]|uniref:hypothetical protein n=1 Tax=Pseudomonas entomophila TaxID=312306 RepID=UPI0021594427|nr:hypothetical protein [Pseudomonas entomophila]
MVKSLKWQEGLVLSFEIEKGIYAISQMRENYLLEIFDMFAEEDEWKGIDLNSVDVLFAIFVSIKNTKNMFSRVIDGGSIKPNRRPVEKYMLSAIFGTPGNTGARLISLSKAYSNIGADIVKSFLSPSHDLDTIYRYELCGMVGDPDKIISRINTYRRTGVNWDPSKEFLFPDIKRPS